MTGIKNDIQKEDFNELLNDITIHFISKFDMINKKSSITSYQIKNNLNSLEIRYSTDLETQLINKLIEKFNIEKQAFKPITGNTLKNAMKYIITIKN